MGYADTLPYQQLRLFTPLEAVMVLDTVADDYEFGLFQIPDFKRPISYATIELHYGALWNSNVLTGNGIDGFGQFGIKDNGGTFRSAQNVVANTIYAYSSGYLYYGDCAMTSKTDLSAYITPGSNTTRPMFSQVKSTRDELWIKNAYGILNLYFNV